MRWIKIILVGWLLLAAGCFRPQAPPLSLANDWGERKTFDYNGIKINYYESGQGQPVVLVHGFAACSYTWRFLAPALSERHRVISIDLKGYGLSDKPRDRRYAISDQADMVADFIRRQDLQDIDLVGHSLGGAVALMTYFKVGEDKGGRIKRLVLMDSAGYPQKMPWFMGVARVPGLAPLGAKILSPRFAAAVALKKCFYDQDKITEERIDAYAYFGSLPGAAEAIIQTARQIVPANVEALIQSYKTIRVPVLIVWGREDEVVPLSVGRKFKRDIPDSELVIIPRCGHIPQEEEPQETTRLVSGFLKN
jgi:pimeloyl-ACP methyl ester carboxylesterase